MHRTLKDETAAPAEANPRRQQKSFDRFRRVFNEERPHEALNMQPPAAVYSPSPRRHPDRVPEPEYDSGLLVRSVYPHGQFFWKNDHIFLTKVLAGERIGLERIDDHNWRVLFASFPVARFDSRDLTIGPLP
jgi:hypothetical protein